jgi:excisionase family DNA binding protein
MTRLGEPRQQGTTAIPGPAPDLLTMSQAAERVGMHRDTLYRLARAGQFPPALQIGSRWLVSVPRLERFLHGDLAES